MIEKKNPEPKIKEPRTLKVPIILKNKSIDYLNSLKEIKKFPKHMHGEYVLLLENNIVKKKYSKNSKKGKIHFKREIKYLKYLNEKGCEFVTQLINWDPKNLILWETYCGKITKDIPENRKEKHRKEKI